VATITLQCRDCESSFDFSDRDQAFFESKGFGPPVRCRDCRNSRRKPGTQASHAGSRPGLHTYECAFCRQEFRTKAQLDPGRGPLRCRDCNEAWKRGDLGNSGYCCECGTHVILPFVPDPSKWIRCKQCRQDWEARKLARQHGFSGPGSSRVEGSGPLAGRRKPNQVNLPGGVSIPIPRSTPIGHGARINRGGPSRSPWQR
jgi:hypothetical protein